MTFIECANAQLSKLFEITFKVNANANKIRFSFE